MRLNTTTNMTAVTPRTNKDSPWIACAGVETGAKMFVGLSGEGVDCAEAVTASTHRPTRTQGATRLWEWCEYLVCIFLWRRTVENCPSADPAAEVAPRQNRNLC